MDNKKILFHINSLGKGGAERVVSVLSGFFAADGCDVIIVTLWRAEEEYDLAADVRRINLGDAWQNKTLGRLQLAVRRLTDFRHVLKKEKPDIVISFCKKANFRCSYAMLGIKTPLLTSVRNDPKVDYLPYKTARRIMEKRASGCVFQTSEAMKCFSGAFQKKSRVIWNPIDKKYLEEKENRNFAECGDYIVTVGRLASQKNQLLLLKAFKRIAHDFPQISVKIYGEESEAGMKEKILCYIKENHLENRVKLMGQCSCLEDEIRDAALFVLPSDYEGMPNALIEAMVMGLPVISTDCPCGGPGELIEHGVSGYLIPVGAEKKLADAMRLLLTDRELAGKLSVNAKKIADKVNPDIIYQEWKDYVDSLVK